MYFDVGFVSQTRPVRSLKLFGNKMSNTQKSIIACWSFLALAISCLAFGWIKIAPFLLLGVLYSRGRFESKERLRRYYSTRPFLYAASIILTALPMLWFLYRLILISDSTGDLGFPEFLPFIPMVLIAAAYDRWTFNQSMSLRSAQTFGQF